MDLLDAQGRRLYLTEEERRAFLDAANKAPRDIRTFCLVLLYTGCRISEGLALAPKSFDFAGSAIVFRTLKKRRSDQYRAVPVPSRLLDTLDLVHNIQTRQKMQGKDYMPQIWPWSRMTAYRRVQEVMDTARIAEGPHKCPKGLRHAYGVHAITTNVPLNMLSKWMGHSRIEMTVIYANALGKEQHGIASRMWEGEA